MSHTTESDLHLDGNAAAGQLAEVFSVEMTSAIGTCDHCGTSRALGMARAYMGGPGTVLRCSACDEVVLRIASLRGNLVVDTGGMRRLEIPG